MGCDAYSNLVLGVEVVVKSELYDAKVTHYHPKTGKPREVEVQCVRVGLNIGSFVHDFPDDMTTSDDFNEANPYASSWEWPSRHVNERVAAYLKARGFKSYNSDIVKPGELAAVNHGKRWFVGMLIATGTNGDKSSAIVCDPHAASAGTIVEVGRICSNRLGLDRGITPSLILLTRLGC